MTLEELLAAAPRFHPDGAGGLRSWQLPDDVLRFLDRHVGDGMRTLEVGAGVSTVIFVLKRAHHVCVTPDPEEPARILAWCRANGLATDRLHFEIERSEDCLPRLRQDGPLDVVLIDGAHGFPVPFLDWCYTANRLRVGGLLFIDDTQVWTGHVLKGFLSAEPEWRLAADFAPRSAVFEKVAAGPCVKNEWQQPFVVAQTLTALRPEYLETARGFAPSALLDVEVRKRRSLLRRLARRIGMIG